jgi:hypothetical protein
MKKVIIKSKLVPWRGNSWYFENPTERIYATLTNPTDEEVAVAMAEAKRQWELMGWTKCFVTEPEIIVA